MPCCAGGKLKVAYLQYSALVFTLDSREMKSLMKIARLRNYSAGEVVVEMGDPTLNFFVIGSGECGIYANTCGREKLLVTKKAGDFFGESAIKQKDMNVPATIRALSDCELVSIHKHQLRRWLKTTSAHYTDYLENIGKIENVLRQLDFFQTLDASELSFLANLFSYKAFQAGDYVFKEGDFGSNLYVMVHGAVSVYKNKVKEMESDAKSKDKNKAPEVIEQEITVEDLVKGAYFGEVALLMNMPRTASIKCKQPSLCLSLSKEDFRTFCTMFENAAQIFDTAMKDRLIATFQHLEIPFFESIPNSKYNELADISELVELPAKHVIFTEGEIGNRFYICLHGQLNVKINRQIIKTMKGGDYFGEIALVTASPRTATVQCIDKCLLLSILKEDFEDFFSSEPAAYATFALRLSKAKAPLIAILYHPQGYGLFRDHIAKEYSLENLDFWKDVCAFPKLVDKGQEKMKAEAMRIKEMYLLANSDRQVNIPDTLQKETVARIESDDIGPDLFAKCMKEIILLMSRDSYPRFKKTPAFETIIDSVVGYHQEKKVNVADFVDDMESGDMLHLSSSPIRNKSWDKKKGGGSVFVRGQRLLKRTDLEMETLRARSFTTDEDNDDHMRLQSMQQKHKMFSKMKEAVENRSSEIFTQNPLLRIELDDTPLITVADVVVDAVNAEKERGSAISVNMFDGTVEEGDREFWRVDIAVLERWL